MAEKKLSSAEEVWLDMQAARLVRLEKLAQSKGVTGNRYGVEDMPIARLNSMLKHAADQLQTLAESTDRTDRAIFVEWAWDEYLRDDWAASLVPPFPLSGFANSSMLARCWAAVETRIHQELEATR